MMTSKSRYALGSSARAGRDAVEMSSKVLASTSVVVGSGTGTGLVLGNSIGFNSILGRERGDLRGMNLE